MILSGQTTLFTNKIEKKEIEKKVKTEIEETTEDLEIIGEEIKDDKYSWKQLDGIDKQNDGYYHVSLELLSHSDLGGTRYGVYSSSTSQNPKGMLGSMYGSGGETFNPNNLEQITKYFNTLMEIKKDNLSKVYREFTDEETKISYEHHNTYYYFRLIPAKNYFIIISDKLVKMLKETGFDFDKWYDEYKSLPENPATEEHWQRALETINLLKQGNKLVGTINQLMSFKKAKENITDLSLYNLSDEEKEAKTKELPLKLKEISDKIKENEEFNGVHYYSREWWWELQQYGILKKNEYI
jgi:3-methyladenine DNA glycosylase Tag